MRPTNRKYALYTIIAVSSKNLIIITIQTLIEKEFNSTFEIVVHSFVFHVSRPI